jgi:hypothetical protein
MSISNFTDMEEDGLIKDGMNVGPPLYRRRSSAAPQRFTGLMHMTTAQWEVLDDFFHNTLFDGVLRFLFPTQGATSTLAWRARFTSPPQRQSVGADSGDFWVVGLNLERTGIGSPIAQTSFLIDPDIFYTPSVFTPSQTLSPSLYTNTNTVYAAQLRPYIEPALFTNTNTFYVPVVSSQRLSPALFTNTNTFYAPTVS